MIPLALLPLLAMLALAQDVSIPAAPSNTSSYVPSNNATQQLVIGLPVGPTGANDPPVFALTDVAAGLPPRDPSAATGWGDHVWNTNPVSSTNITLPGKAIAYINCDSDIYNASNIGLGQVLDNVIAANVSAVLFYSVEQNFCLLGNDLSQTQKDFARYYTMTNPADAVRVLNIVNTIMNGNMPTAEIMTQAAYNNAVNAGQNSSGIDNTPSTAVAMIILYSITGVITALFLVIIVTGAVRAHRHPERYGPHNVLGRPRQSRAKGLARAMLDTLPIVKFGEKQTPKHGDVELGEASTASGTRAADGETDPQTHREADAEASETSGSAGNAAAATASDVPADTANDEEQRKAENVTCSICTEDFEQGQDIRVLPCDHKFHPACVDPWLLDVSGTCPLCRVDLRPQEERASTEGNEQQGEERNSREGEPLPPPLSQGRNRRRDTILNFLDRRRMQDSNSEERISALRRWRQATRRSRAPAQEEPGEPSREGSNETQEQR